MIVLLADVVLYLYAYKLKSTPLIGNLAVGFMTGFGFVFGGFTLNHESIIITSIFLGFFAFVMTTARELVKDIEDMEGDKLEGAKTLPILYGEKITSILAFILIIIDCALCPLLYYANIFGLYYLIVALTAPSVKTASNMSVTNIIFLNFIIPHIFNMSFKLSLIKFV